MSKLNMFKKNIEDKEKYKISNQQLEEYKKRGYELQSLVNQALKDKDYKKAKEYAFELAEIIKFLKKVKKYANKTS